MDEAKRPAWLPDTQGFLAIAIIMLISMIVLILLLRPLVIEERTAGVLMVVIGVLTGSLKDVYSFFFGSSKGSKEKDAALIATATTGPAAPPAPVSTVTKTTDDATVTTTGPTPAPAAAGL